MTYLYNVFPTKFHQFSLVLIHFFKYTRECNPTLTELEAKLAMLENAESAISSTSGMGAITSTILAL
ncbi:PLP-dependent transferase, partial [Clostridioides difficile]|uniref:PLP-dependent transferase n=1 Tax=Clostridioides difficile TaxID=1496 RepID=UPI00265C9392